MTRILQLTALLFVLTISTTYAQTTDSLRQKIKEIVLNRNAEVGVSIIGNNGNDTLTMNGDTYFPMQSVFKFHIALAVLSEVDKGRFSLQQKITIAQKELLPNTWSPIREKYPEGATLTLSEVLGYTVSQSDNNGCDILLRLLGGPEKVEDYFIKNHFTNISIKASEEEMSKAWDVQFQNQTTPKAANEVLTSFYFNNQNLLSQASYDFIWEIMKKTDTGKNRLRGQLPIQTIVAHKTGTSGTNKMGITAAVNDIGLVFLPNGQPYFISVFVTNSKEDTETNEKIIADISKAAWDYFVAKTE
jgi:beta-lactamase class A